MVNVTAIVRFIDADLRTICDKDLNYSYCYRYTSNGFN